MKPVKGFIRSVARALGPTLSSIGSGFACLGNPVCIGYLQYNIARAHGATSGSALKGAFTAAASAYAFQQIGGLKDISQTTRVLLHGTVGGISSVLQGGKFGHGFLSAGLTKLLNVNEIIGTSQAWGMDALRVAAAAIVGGSISKISGSKFGNGAVTAAFGQMFNGNKVGKRTRYTKDIKKAIFEEENYQKAVDLATEYLGEDSSLPTKIDIVFEDAGAAATVSPEGVMTFYKSAFASAERLISTVGHEYIHIEQWKRGTLVTLNQNSQQYYMNEIEATQWEIDNVDITGYQNGFIRNRNQSYSFMQKLTSENQAMIIRKNYEAVK